MKLSHFSLAILLIHGSIHAENSYTTCADVLPRFGMAGAFIAASYLLLSIPCHNHWSEVLNYCGEMTPLMVSAVLGDRVNVEHLLAEGAEVNAMDNGGETALLYAVRRKHEAIVARLIQAGANVNLRKRGWFSYTPLMTAAVLGYKNIVVLLKDAGADLKAQDFWGATARMIAEKKGFLEIAALLE